MRKESIIIAACILLGPSAFGQMVRLNGNGYNPGVYFDVGRVWSYNLYEHSRWGAGVELRGGNGLWNADAWLGYSFYAKLLSCGTYGEWTTRSGTWLAGADRSLVAVGRRSLAAYTLSDLGSLSAFMTRRMSGRNTLTVGHRHMLPRGSVEGRFSVYQGHRLYDNKGLLYAKDGDALAREDGWEATVNGEWRVRGGKLKGQCMLGEVNPGGRAFLRTIGQYEWRMERAGWRVESLIQCGLVSSGAPYPYRFDLGGTWGAPFCFSNTLLTARPNEFTADAYLFASVRLEAASPLYNIFNGLFVVGSMPVPFVGLNAAWGVLRGMDADGTVVHDGLLLQAPYLGIVEPVAGVDGLLRWGLVDWGVAAAWRIVPYGASYRYTKVSNNLSLMVTAKLIL